MEVRTDELRRLLLFQRPPRRYVERRNEHLEFENRFYRVIVRQQVTVPALPGEKEEPRRILVPLGSFPKARRADLIVRSEDGSLLPVMLRRDAATVLAMIFFASWSDSLRVLSTPAEDDEQLRRVLFQAVWVSLVGIISAPEDAAYAHVFRLAVTLQQLTAGMRASPLRSELEALQGDADFWGELLAFAGSTTLLTEVVAVPNRTYVIETSHSDQLVYERAWIGAPLPWLGLSTYSVSRLVANVGYPRSLWVASTMPPGVEIVRYYWRDHRLARTPEQSADPPDAEHAIVQGDRAVIGRRSARSLEADPYLIADTQIAPSAAVATAAALAALALLISAYIYEGIPRLAEDPAARATIISIAGLFSALPAAIAGGLAYRGEAFARHMSRGPRKLIAILAFACAVMAIVVSLKSLGQFVRWLSFSTSIYSLVLLLLFAYIQLGPRWRKGAHSRWKWTTRRVAPGRCRRLQEGFATGYLIVVAFIAASYGRCLFVLRKAHVFTPDFPHNVWHAWITWF